MKRIVCLVLSAVLLLGLIGVGASAEGVVKLVVTGGTVAPGEDVEVLVSIENNPSISGVSGEIKWDESVMTYVDYTAKTTKGVWSMDTFNEDHVILWYYDGLTNAYTGTELISLKFHVAEDATPGEYPVTIELDPDWDAIVDEDNNTIEEFEIQAGTVTVSSKDEPGEVVTLVVSKETAKPGEEVEILVSIENNPSISGVSGEIKWDESVMTYVDYTAKTTKGVWSMDTFNEDHVILWYYDGLTNAYTGTELIALKFKVAEDAAPGEYPVTIELDPDWDAIVDEDNNTIEEFEIVAGSVTVEVDQLEDGYYLIGQNGWTVDDIDPEQKFEPNPANTNEYLLETSLAVGDGIKVVQVTNGAITAWYPDGMDNQYIVDTAHSGLKTIYFKTTHDEAWSQFGGYIWIDAALTVHAEIYGANLSLKGNIGLNFFLILPEELTSDENAYVTLNDTRYPISEAATRTAEEYTVYQFSVNLHAKQMNDEVVVRVFDGEDQPVALYAHSTGEEYTETGYVYTIQMYVEKARKTSTDEKLLALVNAMSDYGSLAQTFLGYNLEKVAEVKADLSAVTVDSVTAYAPKVTTGKATGVSYLGTTLVPQSETVLRIYFTLDEGEIGDYTFKLGSKVVTPVETSAGYYVEVANIAAKNLDKTYTVTVSSAAGKVVTVKASCLSYVYNVLSSDQNPSESLVNLVKGIYLYNQAADAYFAK